MTQTRPHEQDAAIALLADPRTHGKEVEEVERIDTHGAIVFLAGDRAYKMKRAIKLPYLDFSTLDRRKAVIADEIEANRPFAPELYLGAVAITRARGGRLALGGEGEPVEWVLAMRRFDAGATLDRVADRGELTDDVARALGTAVAEAHGRSPRFPVLAWVEALGRFVDDEAGALLSAFEGDERKQASRLCEKLRSELARIAPLLLARGDAGHVRRGHGDLHLRNVALIGGKPVLFDALEFDPAVAAGDVLYDLAFLLMDLLARDLRAAAGLVFNRYLAAAGPDDHLDALTALPFFLALRAAIRARVALDRRKLVEDAGRGEALAEAKRYAALAAKLIAPPPPRLAAIGGLSGTGKSTIAAGLAPDLLPSPGAVHVRSDVERKRLAGVAETERLPPSAYDRQSGLAVYRRINALAARCLAAGHSAVIDAVHARPEEREAAAAVARARGVPFTGIWLTLPLDERIGRIGGRRGDASDADRNVAEAQEAYDPGALDWLRVDASGTPAEVLARVRAGSGL